MSLEKKIQVEYIERPDKQRIKSFDMPVIFELFFYFIRSVMEYGIPFTFKYSPSLKNLRELYKLRKLYKKTIPRAFPLEIEFKKTNRFEHHEITALSDAGIALELANRYPKIFSAYSIVHLVNAMICPEVAYKYNRRFKKKDLYFIAESEISPKLANSYGKRFGGFDIAKLVDANIPPQLADIYSKRWGGEDIAYLVNAKISSEEASKYNKGFNGVDIANLFGANISSEEAKKYKKRFNGSDIVHLIKNNISQKLADEYDARFNGELISELVKNNISPSLTNKYAKKFNGQNVFELVKANILPQYVNKFNRRFNGDDIVNFIKVGCSPEQADQYPLDFDGYTIMHFIKEKISPKEANRYKRFGGGSSVLINAKISPEEANNYPTEFGPEEIVILHNIGIGSDKSSWSKNEYIPGLLKNTILQDTEIKTMSADFRYIATGSSSLVLLKENNAWKFSRHIKKEYKLLNQIQEYHKGNQKNIIRFIDKPKGHNYMRIQYIDNSLENILKQQHTLPTEQIMKYSSGIMNGLIEMRQAGVWYHRDIRPANILVDEKNDRPVIADFSIATRDKHALSKDNRRFGGPNDLVSLGQVMYYMATGKHIFDRSQSMSLTLVADDIKDYRNEIYANPALLQQHLKQVDETVQDERLRTSIKACLTAKNYDYGKMQRMFEEYAK